jgi:uncharacterized protein
MQRYPPLSATVRSIPVRKAIQALALIALAFWIARSAPVRRFYAEHAPVWRVHATLEPKSVAAARIVAGARTQIGTVYDSAYVPISYPGGDVPSDRGACSDVIVRALRNAGADLQQLIHEDMLRDFRAYPHLEGLTRPDSNIDHRRALIQMRFFERHGRVLPTEISPQTLPEWQPGDFVYWELPGNRQHAGVVSDRVSKSAIPLVIHNGNVCVEQDCLTNWKIIGHYRYSTSSEIPPSL